VVVTGATRIGRAHALAFAAGRAGGGERRRRGAGRQRRGCRRRRPADLVADESGRWAGKRGEHRRRRGLDGRRGWFRPAVEEFGALDVLVANAGSCATGCW